MLVKPPKKSLTILHTEASLGWGGQERRILVEALAMRQRATGWSLSVIPGESWVGEPGCRISR